MSGVRLSSSILQCRNWAHTAAGCIKGVQVSVQAKEERLTQRPDRQVLEGLWVDNPVHRQRHAPGLRRMHHPVLLQSLRHLELQQEKNTQESQNAVKAQLLARSGAAVEGTAHIRGEVQEQIDLD